MSLVSGPMTIPADQVMFEGSQGPRGHFNLSTASPGGDYAIEVSDNGRAASTAASIAVIAGRREPPSAQAKTTRRSSPLWKHPRPSGRGAIRSPSTTIAQPWSVRPCRAAAAAVGQQRRVPVAGPESASHPTALCCLAPTAAGGQGNASVGSGLASAMPEQSAVLPGTEQLGDLVPGQAGPSNQVYDGFSDSITVNFVAATGTGTANFQLSIADPNSPIDWNTAVSSMRPPGLPDAAWTAIFANFTAEVGNTMGSLQTALDNDASYLSELGEYTLHRRLIAFQLTQAGDFGAIAKRDTPGMFGLGVPDPSPPPSPTHKGMSTSSREAPPKSLHSNLTVRTRPRPEIPPPSP